MIRKYAEIFWWKNVSSFCSAKATHIFSAKNIILCIESAKTVNEMTLNKLVKLTTLWTTGPRMHKCTGWSECLLGAHPKVHFLTCGPNNFASLLNSDVLWKKKKKKKNASFEVEPFQKGHGVQEGKLVTKVFSLVKTAENLPNVISPRLWYCEQQSYMSQTMTKPTRLELR